MRSVTSESCNSVKFNRSDAAGPRGYVGFLEAVRPLRRGWQSRRRSQCLALIHKTPSMSELHKAVVKVQVRGLDGEIVILTEGCVEFCERIRSPNYNECTWPVSPYAANPLPIGFTRPRDSYV